MTQTFLLALDFSRPHQAMSIHNFSSDRPGSLCWEQPYHHHQHPDNNVVNHSSQDPFIALKFDLNNQEGYEDDFKPKTENLILQEGFRREQKMDKQPMFEKPLTPSDVGKLNRLVIPKQHAEKYFPLSADSVDKGLLLSFEDERGKCWNFRYSYWGSSQSYVLTKGWIRYVKEKRLDAGDVIFFSRHRTDSERLHIGWRRRRGWSAVAPRQHGAGGSGDGRWSSAVCAERCPYPTHNGYGPRMLGQPPSIHAGLEAREETEGAGDWKTLRLFGVNLKCQLQELQPSPPEHASCLYSQAQGYNQH